MLWCELGSVFEKDVKFHGRVFGRICFGYFWCDLFGLEAFIYYSQAIDSLKNIDLPGIEVSMSGIPEILDKFPTLKHLSSNATLLLTHSFCSIHETVFIHEHLLGKIVIYSNLLLDYVRYLFPLTKSNLLNKLVHQVICSSDLIRQSTERWLAAVGSSAPPTKQHFSSKQFIKIRDHHINNTLKNQKMTGAGKFPGTPAFRVSF